ncbi:hypothetical protein QO033_06325, partial [Pseudodonghicola sp. IC7]|nr:hypothetical protein [Pseudodonghicola flavimaris]
MTTNLMMKKEGFKLGTFSSNCSSGMTVTKAPERWQNSWDNNLKLGKMLDEGSVPGDGVGTGVHLLLHSWCCSFTARRSSSPRRYRCTRPS